MLCYFFDFSISINQYVLWRGLHLFYEPSGAEKVILKILDFKRNLKRKNKFLFVSPENVSSTVGEQSDFSFFNKVIKEFSMMIPEEPRHELVDIHTGHILFGVSKEGAHIFSDVFNSTSIFDQIDQKGSIFWTENIQLIFIKKPFFKQISLSNFFELGFLILINFNKRVKEMNQYGQLDIGWVMLKNRRQFWFKSALNFCQQIRFLLDLWQF